MLRLRLITAVVLVGAMSAVLIYAPAMVFACLVLGVVAIALYELLRLVAAPDRWYQGLGVAYGVAVAAAHQWPSLGVPVVPVLLGGCFLLAVAQMFSLSTFERLVPRLGAVCFGAVYIGLGMSYFVWLREADHGRTLVTMTIGMAALSDTFAYSAGRTWGKRKLAPLISPNKTMMGFVAGFAGSVAAAFICRELLWNDLALGPLIGLGLLIGLIAPAGDLIESAVKRGFHVKDTGALLPGHGGMFDRADAYICSAPAVYYYMKYVMGVI